MRLFYLLAAIVGTVLPWMSFGPFLIDHGFNPFNILSALYANGASAGLSTDFFITVFVFWVFITIDAQRLGIRNHWPLFPAALFIGLSMAVPAYLFLREKRTD